MELNVKTLKDTQRSKRHRVRIENKILSSVLCLTSSGSVDIRVMGKNENEMKKKRLFFFVKLNFIDFSVALDEKLQLWYSRDVLLFIDTHSRSIDLNENKIKLRNSNDMTTLCKYECELMVMWSTLGTSQKNDFSRFLLFPIFMIQFRCRKQQIKSVDDNNKRTSLESSAIFFLFSSSASFARIFLYPAIHDIQSSQSVLCFQRRHHHVQCERRAVMRMQNFPLLKSWKGSLNKLRMKSEEHLLKLPSYELIREWISACLASYWLKNFEKESPTRLKIFHSSVHRNSTEQKAKHEILLSVEWRNSIFV